MPARQFKARPVLNSRSKQQGQALIYGLFVLIGGLAALFFLFNTGQLLREKTKLVNTTDAVAYSAGLMNARTLNFDAYTNRAMVANTVAIAQLISLSSWVKYTETLGTAGYVVNNPKYITFYPSYMMAQASGSALQSTLNGDAGSGLQGLAHASDLLIRNALMNAQLVAYAGLIPARKKFMDDIAQANYRNDGQVVIDTVPLTTSDLPQFVTRYSDDERTRFAEVAKVAANKDGFVAKRSWRLPGLWADCASAFPRVDWLDRRGGTELIGFDEWKAMDTLSEKRWVPRGKHDLFCTGISEIPASWSLKSAADSPSTDLNPLHYDSSIAVNPTSSVIAIASSSDDWSYSGLPKFYDLSSDALGKDDPTWQFAIRVRRASDQTVTSEARSNIKSSTHLNAYHATPAGGTDFAAVSASEVFFERDGANKDNAYGRSIGSPREIGSLFNPYWQVRLISSDSYARTAQALQGVVLP